MIDGFYPKIKTIVVPDSVNANHIGDFATNAAADFLDDLGKGAFDPRTVTLRPISERLFALTLRTHKRDTFIQAVDIREPNSRESRILEEGQVVAPRNKVRSR